MNKETTVVYLRFKNSKDLEKNLRKLFVVFNNFSDLLLQKIGLDLKDTIIEGCYDFTNECWCLYTDKPDLITDVELAEVLESLNFSVSISHSLPESNIQIGPYTLSEFQV
jgi:hypothetical protein